RGEKMDKRRYASNFEARLHKELVNLEYETMTFSYSKPTSFHSYTPDFVYPDNPNIVIEAKGYFRTKSIADKYIHIRNSNPNLNIRFILASPNSRAYRGVKLTAARWCEKNKFEWCDANNIPKHWKNRDGLK